MEEGFPPPPFEGFRPAALTFFRDLAANQTKTWFEANRAAYETEVKLPLAALIGEVAGRLAAKGLVFSGDAKRAMFRLNRDVRFSHDKSPYKTHAGAAMTRDGVKTSPGVLYLHIDPEGCFVAAGFYHPEPEALGRMRQALVAKPDRWRDVIKALKKHGLELDREDALARAPKGYDPVPAAVAEDIKLKSWVVSSKLAEERVFSPGLVGDVVDFALAAAPLLEFGWRSA